LLRYRRNFGGARYLEVVTTPAQVDHTGIVRILEDTDEHAVAEALAVAAEQLPCTSPNLTGPRSIVVVGGERFDGTAHEVECFVAREALATNSDDVAGGCSGPFLGNLKRCGHVDACRGSAIAVSLWKLVARWLFTEL
jgi:hypothetical protein